MKEQLFSNADKFIKELINVESLIESCDLSPYNKELIGSDKLFIPKSMFGAFAPIFKEVEIHVEISQYDDCAKLKLHYIYVHPKGSQNGITASYRSFNNGETFESY